MVAVQVWGPEVAGSPVVSMLSTALWKSASSCFQPLLLPFSVSLPALHFMPLPPPSKSGLSAGHGNPAGPYRGGPIYCCGTPIPPLQSGTNGQQLTCFPGEERVPGWRSQLLGKDAGFGNGQAGLSSTLCYLAGVWRVAPSLSPGRLLTCE